MPKIKIEDAIVDLKVSWLSERGTPDDAKMIAYIPKAGMKISQNNTTNTFSIQSLHENVIIGDSLINMPYLS